MPSSAPPQSKGGGRSRPEVDGSSVHPRSDFSWRKRAQDHTGKTKPAPGSLPTSDSLWAGCPGSWQPEGKMGSRACLNQQPWEPHAMLPGDTVVLKVSLLP